MGAQDRKLLRQGISPRKPLDVALGQRSLKGHLGGHYPWKGGVMGFDDGLGRHRVAEPIPLGDPLDHPG